MGKSSTIYIFICSPGVINKFFTPPGLSRSYCIQTVLTRFDKKNIDFVISQLKRSNYLVKKKDLNFHFIDSAIVLRTLLAYYRAEKT